MAIIEVTVKGIDKLDKRLKQLGIALPKVMVRAVNRTIDASGTMAKREVAAATGLKQKYVARALEKRRATPASLLGSLIARETFIPLFAYLGRVRYRSGEGIAGTTYQAGTVPPGAFFAIMKQGGHKGVFRRTGAQRLPIRELPGPPIPKVILDHHIFQALQSRAEATLGRRIEVELERLAKGQSATGGA